MRVLYAEHGTSDVEQRKEDQQEDRDDEGELSQGLSSFSPSRRIFSSAFSLRVDVEHCLVARRVARRRWGAPCDVLRADEEVPVRRACLT